MHTQTCDPATATAPEPFVIRKTTEGYRVCSPLTPANQYVVTGIPDDPHCTCPDFMHPDCPPDWLCPHIQAVLDHAEGAAEPPPNGAPAPAASTASDGPPSRKPRKAPAPKNDKPGAVMLLKRSVSPDGKIDSFSVQFSCPVDGTTTAEIKQQAATVLALQADIEAAFLKTSGRNGNGTPAPQNNGGNGNGAPGAVNGRMLAVGSMNSRWGRRLFLNVQVGDEVLKLFGTQKQLSTAVAEAGYASMADHLADGMTLNLPCRVITKPSPDGRYTNVERVLPVQAGERRA